MGAWVRVRVRTKVSVRGRVRVRIRVSSTAILVLGLLLGSDLEKVVHIDKEGASHKGVALALRNAA